jgi:hypothetical protein
MKASIYISLLLLIVSCKSTLSQNSPQKIFQNHISVVEQLLKGEEVSNLKTTIEFLEEITNIKSEVDIGWEIMYSPSEQNLKDWKTWYRNNKKLLYWDEKENKVKVRI